MNFLRHDIHTLPSYTPPALPDLSRVLKLDANENHFGPSPRVAAALASMSWEYYPSVEPLRADLAAYAGCAPEEVVVSNGADEMIDLVLRAAFGPGQAIVDCPPTFDMYSILARRNFGRVFEVERRADFSVDVEAVCRAQRESGARVVFLTSPNNPTGNLLPLADLERLLALDALIVVDEAYAEFAGESVVSRIARHENLCVLRTFSKWAGLAGLRIGYGVFAPRVAMAVNRVRSPYNVNAAAVAAAQASLADREYLLANVQRIIAERERMVSTLGALGFLQPYPSRANFILCRVMGRDAHEVRRALFERDIWIRAYDAPRLREFIRISIGRPEENDRVLEALGEIG